MFFVSLNAYMAEEETNMQLQKSIESFDELEYQKKMLTEQQFQNSGALTAFKQSTQSEKHKKWLSSDATKQLCKFQNECNRKLYDTLNSTTDEMLREEHDFQLELRFDKMKQKVFRWKLDVFEDIE